MTGEKTILVVDDDPGVLAGLELCLSMEGYNVLTARDGQEALDLMEKTCPDLIVADIMMPRMDGYEFYEKVRRRAGWVTIPFIFLTAKGEKSDIRHGKLLGVDDYLTKPVETDDLLIAIESRLRRIREVRSAAEKDLDKLKSRILATLSHEFRTPLAHIQLGADLLDHLLSELQEDEGRLAVCLEAIKTGGERLERLIEDFLMVVRLESGEEKRRFNREKREVSTKSCLEQTVEQLLGTARKKGVEIHLDISTDLPPVLACPQQLREVFFRLLDNAIKFSDRGTKVLVKATSTRRHILLSFTNHGQVIPRHEIPKIFDRFYQVERDKYEQQGTGLGLAIVKGLIDIHGGSIEVQSYNRQTTFTVTLPISDQAVKPSPNKN